MKGKNHQLKYYLQKFSLKKKKVTKILYLMKKFTHTNQKNKEVIKKVTESMATRSLGLTNQDLEVEEEEE